MEIEPVFNNVTCFQLGPQPTPQQPAFGGPTGPAAGIGDLFSLSGAVAGTGYVPPKSVSSCDIC